MQNNYIIDDLVSEFGAGQQSDHKSNDVIKDFEDKTEASKKKKKKAAKKKGIEVFSHE